ncbi:MAG: radical SAM protein [Polyangia bacterium]
MKLALVYPPTCDPTAPYLAVPMLTGFLRARGVEVLPIDANIEAFDQLLEPEPLSGLRDRIEHRLHELDRRSQLDHADQLLYASLWQARGDAHAAPHGIARAKATLRDPERFFDPAEYAGAVNTIEAALRAISAAHAPLHLDFTAYRTPFSLTTPAEILADAAPERDPFHAYTTGTLIPRLREQRVDVVGLSVCFPGQLQPALAMAHKIKQELPHVHVTAGGPGITQLMIRHKGTALLRALGPLDTAVVFEGEHTLLRLLEALDRKAPLRELQNVVVRDPLMGARYLSGHGMEDLTQLPAPDFDGLPLDRYLAPFLTLPYDPTRGCYWGKCTFCHYGLAEVGTAKYRERQVPQMLEHLSALSEKYGTRYFYFSQDSVAPKTLLKLADGLIESGLKLRWATDLKPEKYLTPERAQTLRKAGAVACALGVESAAPRVLKLIDKGAPVETVRDVITRLGDSGIAVEAMCFTDFPTETAPEALATLRFLDELRDNVALFIVGQFGLTHGALVAQAPQDFGLKDTWQLEGDELGTGLFFAERVPAKSDADRARVERALDRLAGGWQLRHYPWAGALSTAHTVYYYDRMGREVFRKLAAQKGEATIFGRRVEVATARFCLEDLEDALTREAEIWSTLVYEQRRVSREAYRELAEQTPPVTPRPTRYRFVAGEPPTQGPGARKVIGRRPSGSVNSLG